MKIVSAETSKLATTVGPIRIQLQRTKAGKPITGEQSTSFTVDGVDVHECKDTLRAALAAFLEAQEGDADADAPAE